MRMRLARLALVIIAVMAVGAIGVGKGGALAKEQDYSNPKVVMALIARLDAAPDARKAFLDLPPKAQAAVLKAHEVVSVQEDVSVEPGESLRGGNETTVIQSAGCWTWTRSRSGKNLLGMKLWTYKQQINWCGDGAWVTALWGVNSWGETHFPLWEYLGVVGSWQTGGVGWNLFERWSQGHFALCAEFCAQHKYPWIDMRVYGDGGYWSQTGG